MAHKAQQPPSNLRGVQFPPEASDDFDVVSVEEIAAWREKLNERFGIGKGRLKPLDVLPVR